MAVKVLETLGADDPTLESEYNEYGLGPRVMNDSVMNPINLIMIHEPKLESNDSVMVVMMMMMMMMMMMNMNDE